MNVELRHLRAAIAVADAANFTRAAETLRIAQPSLSQTIRHLESYLGFKVFNRTTRNVALTHEGELFLAEAVAVLEQFEQSMDHLSRVSTGEAGSLRVGYLIGAAVEYVPRILRCFSEQFPAVTVHLSEYDFSQPNAGLDTGASDVAIVRPPLEKHRNVRSELLLNEGCMVCVPVGHRFASWTTVPVDDLLPEPIVAAPGNGPWRDFWLLASVRTAPPQVTWEAPTFEAELQAVAAGRGVSVVPQSVGQYYSRPGVQFVPLPSEIRCHVSVAWRNDGSPAAENFARLAVAQCAHAQPKDS